MKRTRLALTPKTTDEALSDATMPLNAPGSPNERTRNALRSFGASPFVRPVHGGDFEEAAPGAIVGVDLASGPDVTVHTVSLPSTTPDVVTITVLKPGPIQIDVSRLKDALAEARRDVEHVGADRDRAWKRVKLLESKIDAFRAILDARSVGLVEEVACG